MSTPTSFRATVSLAPILGCLAIAALILPASGAASGNGGDLSHYRNIPLWEPGKVPLATGTGPLDNPFLTAFLPAEGKRNGASVVIAPGGANIMLMYGAEGLDIAERYNDWGVTAFVLTYRLSPRYGENARVLDGTRAIQLVRANAAAWKLDPARIGYIGFSAGSNMGRSVVAAARAGRCRAPPTQSTASARDPTIWRSSMAPDERHRANRSKTFRRPFSSRQPAIRDRRWPTRSCSWT